MAASLILGLVGLAGGLLLVKGEFPQAKRTLLFPVIAMIASAGLAMMGKSDLREARTLARERELELARRARRS